MHFVRPSSGRSASTSWPLGSTTWAVKKGAIICSRQPSESYSLLTVQTIVDLFYCAPPGFALRDGHLEPTLMIFLERT